MKRSVLQLIGSFHTGGSERQAVQLAGLLKKDGTYQVFSACLEKQGALLEEFEKQGFGEIPEFRLTSFYDANFLGQIRRCVKFIRENNIEIVQTHDFYTNVFGMIAAKIARVPARIAAKRETGEMRSAAQRLIEKRAFGFANAIVVNSEAVKDFLKKQGIAESKMRTVYNGLDLERLKPEEIARRDAVLRNLGLPVDSNKKLVTIVANLRHAVKNQEMFLRAASRVKKQFVNAAFILAGEGERENELKALAEELKIENDVIFAGRCEKIPALLSVSEICVLSSKAEGFSNAILEYMAASRPVVATNVGGAAEAIEEGETGSIVESNDDPAMAEKISFLLEHPETSRKMGERGCQIVEQKFSLEAQLARTLELYEELLKK